MPYWHIDDVMDRMERYKMQRDYKPDTFSYTFWNLSDEKILRKIEFYNQHLFSQFRTLLGIKKLRYRDIFIKDVVNFWKIFGLHKKSQFFYYQSLYKKEWESRKQRKLCFKAVKEELLPIAWHPSRHWDWCMPEDEKKEISKLWS